MGWTPEETRLFVKLYLDHTCLWNVEDNHYKYNRKRLQAYRDIIDKFNALTNIKLDEAEVRQKIKNLRATYAQFLHKLRRERRSFDDIFESSTKAKWIKDIHKSFSSIAIPRNMYEEGVSCDEPETDVEELPQNVWVSEDSIQEEHSYVSNNSPISPTQDDYILLLNDENDDTQPKSSYKRRRNYKRHNSLANSSTVQSENSVTTNSTNEDEFDIYGKYIASQLREMGLQRALRVQLQIQNIVGEARLKSLSDNSQN